MGTCVLAYPTRRWCDDPTLDAASVALRYPGGLPGMGYLLTAEFLRNLGYNGFKPDRQIVRLLLQGLDVGNGVPDQSQRAAALSKVAGRPPATDVTETIRTCLVGAAITPDEYYSRTDNVLWLLGSCHSR